MTGGQSSNGFAASLIVEHVLQLLDVHVSGVAARLLDGAEDTVQLLDDLPLAVAKTERDGPVSVVRRQAIIDGFDPSMSVPRCILVLCLTIFSVYAFMLPMAASADASTCARSGRWLRLTSS